jgi:hypothetical protein
MEAEVVQFLDVWLWVVCFGGKLICGGFQGADVLSECLLVIFGLFVGVVEVAVYLVLGFTSFGSLACAVFIRVCGALHLQ